MQYSGIPTTSADPSVEAGIVALKTRTIAVEDAVSRSLAALEWLKAQGCEQFLFKYCSTFDSTPEGNIGPVIDALADALDATRVIVCPAFPSLNRSIYAGHLFVGDKLLSESGMENHPLTPMTDPDLRRWLSLQSRSKVGHVPAATILKGRAAIKAALDSEHETGARLIVTDTIQDGDLIEIGAAAAELPLLTGGSGIALGLPMNFRASGKIGESGTSWAGLSGSCVAISGSCSTATREQVALHSKTHPTLEVTAESVMSGTMTPEAAADWAKEHRDDLPLIYSSTDPETVKKAQDMFGKLEIANRIEHFLATTACLLADAGFTNIVSAGGETSGAVVEALKVDAMEIGPEIDPGVPALKASGRDLALALKSGNFGRAAFFAHAAEILGNK